MRKAVPIILIAVLVAGVGYYFYARAHRVQSIRGPVLSAQFLDKDFGNAVILKTPEGKVVVVDPVSNDGTAALIDLLRVERVRETTVVVSTQSSDSANALAKLQGSLKVVRVVHAGPDESAERWKTAKTRAKCRPVAETALSCGAAVRLSRTVRLEMLCQQAPVFRVRCGDKSIMFFSRLSIKDEPQLMSLNPQSSVLCIRRRDRWDIPSLELLSAVRPEVCIISAGSRGPSTSLVRRLSPGNTGAALYRTDEDGIIEIVTNGRSLQVLAGGGP